MQVSKHDELTEALTRLGDDLTLQRALQKEDTPFFDQFLEDLQTLTEAASWVRDFPTDEQVEAFARAVWDEGDGRHWEDENGELPDWKPRFIRAGLEGIRDSFFEGVSGE